MMSTCLGIWNQRYGEETFKQVAVINRNPWLRPSGLSGLRFTGLGGRDFGSPAILLSEAILSVPELG